MSKTIILSIKEKYPSSGPPPTGGSFRLVARDSNNKIVCVIYVTTDPEPGDSVYVNCTPPVATLHVSIDDYNTLWNCPVPSVADHHLKYDFDHPSVPPDKAYPVEKYEHCCGTITFPGYRVNRDADRFYLSAQVRSLQVSVAVLEQAQHEATQHLVSTVLRELKELVMEALHLPHGSRSDAPASHAAPKEHAG